MMYCMLSYTIIESVPPDILIISLSVSHTTDSPYHSVYSSRTHLDPICEYQYPNKGEIKYHMLLILLLFVSSAGSGWQEY